MMKKPTFDKLDEIFEHITSLRLTDREYADKTGASLPKRKSYLVNESAFSRWLNEKDLKLLMFKKKPSLNEPFTFKRSRRNFS